MLLKRVLGIIICILPVTITGTPSITVSQSPVIQGDEATIICTDPDAAYFGINRGSTSIGTCILASSCSFKQNKSAIFMRLYTLSQSVSPKSVTFGIKNATRTIDGGVWRCETNSGSTTIFIDVQVTVPIPIIYTTGLSFTDGKISQITCRVGESHPRPTVAWSIDGRPQPTTSITTTSNSDNTNTTSILQYTADKSDNKKPLRCTASNGIGDPKTDTLTLDVRYPPVVNLNISETSYRIKRGGQLVLECISESKPVVPLTGYIWERDGGIIQGQRSSEYRIHTVDTSHGGHYTCMATNTVGSTTSSPKLVEIIFIPDNPTNVKVKIATTNQICVEWKPGFNDGKSQSFIVQHSTDNITWVESSPISDGTNEEPVEYCITDLKPDTSYTIRMMARNKFLTSQTVYFQTSDTSRTLKLEAVPDNPTNLKVKFSTTNRICVGWKPRLNGGDSQSFIVQHSTDNITWVESSPIPDGNNADPIDYCIPVLTPDTSYNIRMMARNTFGTSQTVYFPTSDTSRTQKLIDDVTGYDNGRADGIGVGVGIGIGVMIVMTLIVLFVIYLIRRFNTGKTPEVQADENYSTLTQATAGSSTYQQFNLMNHGATADRPDDTIHYENNGTTVDRSDVNIQYENLSPVVGP